MAAKRDWYRYAIMVGDNIVYIGITTNPELRAAEHKQRWPNGTFVVQGPA